MTFSPITPNDHFFHSTDFFIYPSVFQKFDFSTFGTFYLKAGEAIDPESKQINMSSFVQLHDI